MNLRVCSNPLCRESIAKTTLQLYHDALTLLDASSLERVRRFYHRADACRTYHLIRFAQERALLSN
jgi:hypothetical protein